jgi:PAS domain S-box-containing protein
VPLTLASLVPAGVRRAGPDAVRRARAVMLAGVLTAGVSGYVAWNQAAQGAPKLALPAGLIGLIGLAITPGIWLTGVWKALGILLCGVLFGGIGTVIVLTGGAMPAPSYLLAVVPLFAMLTLGPAWGVAAATACTGLLWLTHRLAVGGVEFPVVVPPDVVARSTYRGAIIFQGLLTLIAFVLESLRADLVREASESEARYGALGAQSNDLLFELDVSGRVRFANSRHCEALGWSPDALIGSDLPAFVHRDDAGRFTAILVEALERGGAQGVPVRLCAPDGSSRWFEPSVTAYTTSDGHRRLVAVARDLTERVRLEEQLRQSQKMDAIGQLAGGVAHDFNNLSMVVGSYAEQLVRKLPAGPHRIAAEEIARAAERGEILTRQLLAVSRPETAHPRPIVLNDVVDGLRRMLARLITEDVVMELSLDRALPAGIADPGHVEQIVVNLATNARDAMPRGGALRIRTSAGDGRVRLEVTDTGVGMDDATRERVFEAFFTTKERGRGTGLGL